MAVVLLAAILAVMLVRLTFAVAWLALRALLAVSVVLCATGGVVVRGLSRAV